jgi:glutamate-1-semialdehyde aminotransferase
MREFDKVFFSTTYGGEALTLAAAAAGLDFYEHNDVIGKLWRSGTMVMDGFAGQVAAKQLGAHVSVAGFPVRMQLAFHDIAGAPSHLYAAIYQQEMFRRGIICYTGVMSVSYAHTDAELDYTVKSFGEAMDVLAAAVTSNDPEKFLEGKPPVPVFRALREQRTTGN